LALILLARLSVAILSLFLCTLSDVGFVFGFLVRPLTDPWAILTVLSITLPAMHVSLTNRGLLMAPLNLFDSKVNVCIKGETRPQPGVFSSIYT
jgi:hypothetical protein